MGNNEIDSIGRPCSVPHKSLSIYFMDVFFIFIIRQPDGCVCVCFIEVVHFFIAKKKKPAAIDVKASTHNKHTHIHTATQKRETKNGTGHRGNKRGIVILQLF